MSQKFCMSPVVHRTNMREVLHQSAQSAHSLRAVCTQSARCLHTQSTPIYTQSTPIYSSGSSTKQAAGNSMGNSRGAEAERYLAQSTTLYRYALGAYTSSNSFGAYRSRWPAAHA
mmetsp:Transcript_64807/g.193679  ORF Transcript_64807/g.193679 Transcript_64807/m.193679 type:complete len:115 (+) Transcript_64807:927-1271(+)